MPELCICGLDLIQVPLWQVRLTHVYQSFTANEFVVEEQHVYIFGQDSKIGHKIKANKKFNSNY